jgi:hypothetical protein
MAGAFVVGLLGLSITWPSGMPFSLWVGAAAAMAWVAVMVLVRLAQRRAQRATALPRS